MEKSRNAAIALEPLRRFWFIKLSLLKETA